MGRIRVPGLQFDLKYLEREITSFRKFAEDSKWMTNKNLINRKAVVSGLLFIMLNIAENDEKSWALYHQALDFYYERCDKLGIIY